jgi:subtilisin family serine protease
MRSAEERLTRLLERHTDFYELSPDGPGGAIIRRDEMLVPARHASGVETSARRWTDRRTDVEALGVARFRLSRGTDVADLIATRLTPESGDAQAFPVHMFRGEPNYQGGPGGVPAPLGTPPPAPSGAPSGRAVTVAVLDTGITPTHPWFPDESWDGVGDEAVDDLMDTDNDYELDAQAGHGTFIAGIVRQHAPGARLMVGRVLGSDGVCDEVDLLMALHALRERKRKSRRRIDIVNLSLGAYTWNDRPPALLSAAIDRLGDDTVVVAAAGNNSSDRVFWPAAFDSVVAVGALTADGGAPASFSNHGGWVDAWAPGADVASSFVTFDGPEEQAPGSDIHPDCFTGYATWSGTSFAAPRVAAEVARRSQLDGSAPRSVLPAALAEFPPVDGGTAAGAAGQ